MGTKCRCEHGAPWFVVCPWCAEQCWFSDWPGGLDRWDGSKPITLESIQIKRLNREVDALRHLLDVTRLGYQGVRVGR